MAPRKKCVFESNSNDIFRRHFVSLCRMWINPTLSWLRGRHHLTPPTTSVIVRKVILLRVEPPFPAASDYPPAHSAPPCSAPTARSQARRSGLAAQARPGTPSRGSPDGDVRSACVLIALREQGGRSRRRRSRSCEQSLSAQARAGVGLEAI